MRNGIRDARVALGWSQKELGERLGVSRQTVNALEAGRWDPSLKLAFKAAEVLNEPIDALFDATSEVVDG